MRAHDVAYVPALTGLRGIAAWWVVVYHFSDPIIDVIPAWLLAIVRHGYISVDLFFILSGYVIYLTSGQSFRVLSRGVVYRFLLNRLIRIYPLHFVIMLAYLVNPLALWLFSSSGVGDGRYDWEYFVASMFLVQNWGGFDELQWNMPAWSISAEFAAYIFCPILAAATISWLSNNFWKLVLLIVCLVTSFGYVFFSSGATSIGEKITSLGLFRCVVEFWVGLCLGVMGGHGFKGIRNNKALGSVSIVCLIMIPLFLVGYGISDYWLVPIAFTLLIYILSKGDAIFSVLLSSKWIHYLGLISYSTYLVHFLIKDWVKFLNNSIGVYQFLLYILLCFLASVALYNYVEEPARRMLRQRLVLEKKS